MHCDGSGRGGEWLLEARGRGYDVCGESGTVERCGQGGGDVIALVPCVDVLVMRGSLGRRTWRRG